MCSCIDASRDRMINLLTRQYDDIGPTSILPVVAFVHRALVEAAPSGPRQGPFQQATIGVVRAAGRYNNGS